MTLKVKAAVSRISCVSQSNCTMEKCKNLSSEAYFQTGDKSRLSYTTPGLFPQAITAGSKRLGEMREEEEGCE